MRRGTRVKGTIKAPPSRIKPTLHEALALTLEIRRAKSFRREILLSAGKMHRIIQGLTRHVLFGCLPERFHFFERRIVRIDALASQLALDKGKARAELRVGRAERFDRIDA